ncbi:MAG: HAMP domain-containing histidine kinase [Deltaproteobacteria bacterium]|nr:HAMP domain-containing histidine kinase [Deltaproteobacteria bacterium]
MMLDESPWKQEVARARTFVGNRFAEVWEDPAARARLAEAFYHDLDVDIVVRDEAGAVLAAAGGKCPRGEVSVPVLRDGRRIGTVAVCMARHRHTSWYAAAPFLLAVLTLWAASGLIARRLARPLRVVASAAGEIGKGKLATRVVLGHHSYREARVLAEVINDMAARIERQLADQKALLAAVSHEIRTPLARMRLLTEMGRDKALDTKTLDEIDREVVEVDVLVSQLLASSRLDFSAMTRKTLNAVDLAREALERAGVDGAKLVVEADAPTFEGDPTLVARVLANLIDNANRHGEGVEALRVTTRDGRVAFEVEDNGPGFEPGEQEKIFEAFYHRARKESEEGRSVGLGLALVRRIAEAHGGKAYAKNRQGGGAVVGVEL